MENVADPILDGHAAETNDDNPAPDASPEPDAFVFTWFDGATLTRAKRARVARAEELIEHAHPDDGRKKDAYPVWSPALYPDGQHRANAAVVAVSALVADIDDGTPIADVVGRLRDVTDAQILVHTSYSYTPEKPKYLVIMPLARPVAAEDFPAAWGWMADVMGCVDPGTHDVSRIYFVPIARPGFYTETHDGPRLDRPWHEMLPPTRRATQRRDRVRGSFDLGPVPPGAAAAPARWAVGLRGVVKAHVGDLREGRPIRKSSGDVSTHGYFTTVIGSLARGLEHPRPELIWDIVHRSVVAGAEEGGITVEKGWAQVVYVAEREIERREEEEREAARLEAARDLAHATATVEVSAALDLPDGVTWPAGYAVGQGVAHVGADAPFVERLVLVRAIGTDVDSGAETWTVTWRREGGGWDDAVLPASVASDGRTLAALRDRGAPTSAAGGVSSDVAVFLHRFVEVNRAVLPRRRTMARLGWTPSFDAFAGGAWNVGDVAGPTAPGIGEAGVSVDAWVERVGRWATPARPAVRLMLATALASPLLAMIGVAGFTVDAHGRTSGGKTSAAHVAEALFGRPGPGGMAMSWDTTAVGLERSFAERCHLPVSIDDSALALQKLGRERVGGLASDIAYSVTNGCGRRRGARGGGLETPGAWCLTAISTGESSMLTLGGRGVSEGALARVLSVSGAPFGAEGARDADAARAFVAENYGRVGRAWVTWLHEHRDDRDDWAREVTAAVEGQGIAARTGGYHATIDLVVRLADEALGLDLSGALDAVSELGAAGDGDTTDPIERAWDYVHELYASRARAFYPSDAAERSGLGLADIPPADGWWGSRQAGEVAWLPSKLAEVLSGAGYDPIAVVRRWDEQGRLVTGSGKARRARRRVDGAQVWCVVLKVPEPE